MKKLIVAFSNFANTPKIKVLKKINNLKLEETIFRNIQMFCSKTKKQMFSWKKKNFYFCVFSESAPLFCTNVQAPNPSAHTFCFHFLSILDLLLLPTSEK